MTHQYEDSDSLTGRITRHFRGTLIGGLLLLVPVIITYVVLRWLFYAIDGLLQPFIQEAFNRNVPGLGAIVLVIIIYIAGVAEENYFGRRVFDLVKNIMLRIPIINAVYSPAKQLIDALSGNESSGFRQVVMIEYPRKDAWTIGFMTSSTSDWKGNPLSIVYIPTAPTPNSGWVAIVPEKDVFYTDLNVSTAMRLVLSGGIIAPNMIGARQYS